MTKREYWPGLGKKPRNMMEIVRELKRRGNLARPNPLRSFARCWCEASGPDIALHTRVERFRAGVLTILCDSSAMVGELAGFYNADLLSRVRHAGPPKYVERLEFKLGKVSEDS